VLLSGVQSYTSYVCDRPVNDSGIFVVRTNLPVQANPEDEEGGQRAGPKPGAPRRARQFPCSYPNLMRAIHWLKAHNPLYKDIDIVMPDVDDGNDEDDSAECIPILRDMDHAVVLDADPQMGKTALAQAVLRQQRQPASRREETLYFDLKRNANVPLSCHTEKALEALAFPGLYPTGEDHYGESVLYIANKCVVCENNVAHEVTPFVQVPSETRR
jgi:hypothetical protein